MLRFCSFHERREDRCSRHIRGQTGNSMNVFCMAVIDFHSLVCWKTKPLPLLLKNIHFNRQFMIQEILRKKERSKMAGTQRSIEQFIDVEPADAPSSKKGKGRKTVQSEKVVSPPVKRFRCNGKQPEPSLTGTPDAPKHFLI